MTFTILGAGIAGLGCSYYLGHEKCIIFEKNSYHGGHVATHRVDDCQWDEGPHISFTKHESVRGLLSNSANCNVLEFQASVGNWYQGCWISHPAQSNLHAVPKPLAGECLKDFLASRVTSDSAQFKITNYAEWLDYAFGKTFAKTFPSAYTRKYWTCEPEQLTTDWVGERVYSPDIQTIKEGYEKPPSSSSHYITCFRYPEFGGFVTFTHGLEYGSQLFLDHNVTSINLESKIISFENGLLHKFDKLINTLPLNYFIGLVDNVPPIVKEASEGLICTSILLVNIKAEGTNRMPYHWFYVYDENLYSTRITQTNLLSENNTPNGFIGIQVEVYESRLKPFTKAHNSIAEKVVEEVKSMGLIGMSYSVSTQYVPFANVVCDHSRRERLDIIFSWLEQFGLQREPEDLDPMTDWSNSNHVLSFPCLAMAGRFAQWKYYWTDDCLLRAAALARSYTN